MTITIPKPLVALGAMAFAALAAYMAYEEIPALRRYIKFESM